MTTKHRVAIVFVVFVLIVGAVFALGQQNVSVAPTVYRGSLTPAVQQKVASIGATAQGEVKEIRMTASTWKFEPSTITVQKGQRVRLILKSEDVAHGIGLPDFQVNETVGAGEEKTIEFVADKKGTFVFFCSVFCGKEHTEMKGSLVVE